MSPKTGQTASHFTTHYILTLTLSEAPKKRVKRKESERQHSMQVIAVTLQLFLVLKYIKSLQILHLEKRVAPPAGRVYLPSGFRI